MASEENELGQDHFSNNNSSKLPLPRVMKEEPMDEYGEGLDKDSRIAHLKKLLIESENRTRTVDKELEEAARTVQAETIERMKLEDELNENKADFEKERKDLSRKLEESERAREKLKESLNREQNERERENERDSEIIETKKRQVDLEKENKDLQDQVKSLTERLESLNFSLAEARFMLEDSETRVAQLEAEVVTPNVANVQANTRQRTEERPLHSDDSNEMAEFALPIADSVDNLSTTPNFTHCSFPMKSKEENVESKEEPVDTTQAMGDSIQISALDSLGDGMDLMGDETLNGNVAVDTNDNAMEDDPIDREGDESNGLTTDALKDPIDNELIEKEKEKEKRSSGNYINLDDLDEDSEPPVKKLRSDSQKEKKGKDKERSSDNNGVSTIQDGYCKTNDKELECPECDFFTLSVGSWIGHLRNNHSTTPSLAGLALLCECGHESLSHGHSQVCAISNFTIIQKREGPIRRINDEKTTPKCVLCEKYPSTPGGYIAHLHNHHKSTLKKNGIAWLTCGCGSEVRSSKNNGTHHSKGCDHRQFAIHKLDKE